VAEDKDPLWNEMNREIKNGVRLFCGCLLFLSGLLHLFVCGFLCKKKITVVLSHQNVYRVRNRRGRRKDKNERIGRKKPARKAPVRGP
jgi:hypothetical protein